LTGQRSHNNEIAFILPAAKTHLIDGPAEASIRLVQWHILPLIESFDYERLFFPGLDLRSGRRHMQS